jgi:glucuronoarabinoxylan endo-1,4-beta-xylanase
MPGKSLSTFIFTVDDGSTAIENVNLTDKNAPKTYYDLHGRRLDTPHGLCIERSIDGTSRKIMIR